MQILTKYKGGSLANSPTADAILSPKDAVEVRREFITESSTTAHTFVITGAPVLTRSSSLATGVWTTATNGTTAAAYALASAVPVTQAASGRVISYECYAAMTDVTTASIAMFVGLSSSGTVSPVTTAGVPDGTRSSIGFAFNQGNILGCFGSAAGGTVTLATGNTAGTYRRLGFVVKGTASIDWYIDGAYVTTSTTVPTTVMFESYSTAAAAATGISVDWTHIAYNR
jgi:hypothetical protein